MQNRHEEQSAYKFKAVDLPIGAAVIAGGLGYGAYKCVKKAFDLAINAIEFGAYGIGYVASRPVPERQRRIANVGFYKFKKNPHVSFGIASTIMATNFALFTWGTWIMMKYAQAEAAGITPAAIYSYKALKRNLVYNKLAQGFTPIAVGLWKNAQRSTAYTKVVEPIEKSCGQVAKVTGRTVAAPFAYGVKMHAEMAPDRHAKIIDIFTDKATYSKEQQAVINGMPEICRFAPGVRRGVVVGLQMKNWSERQLTKTFGSKVYARPVQTRNAAVEQDNADHSLGLMPVEKDIV